MKIIVNIEASSVEEAQAAFHQLAGLPSQNTVLTVSPDLAIPAPVEEKQPEKKTRATKKEADPLASAPAADPISPASDPLAPTTGDPLSTPAPITTGDPLSAPATSADPLASNPVTEMPVSIGEISLSDVRAKISTLGEKKQQVKDLVATYKKADGTACEKPSDLQEKDYADILNDLDFI